MRVASGEKKRMSLGMGKKGGLLCLAKEKSKLFCGGRWGVSSKNNDSSVQRLGTPLREKAPHGCRRDRIVLRVWGGWEIRSHRGGMSEDLEKRRLCCQSEVGDRCGDRRVGATARVIGTFKGGRGGRNRGHFGGGEI